MVTSATAALDGFAPAVDLLAALRERQISSTELVELHLRRIARFNSRINAIVVPAADPREAARASDAERAAPGAADRRLLGLPVTLKESMNVRGMPVSAGIVELADYRATDDGPIPARVLGAGAVLLGKTNIPPMLADWQSANPIYGRTVNPWNPDLTPGGSTGGGAAAVAAGLTPLEFGSDIGGSIRVPAAFCGVFGHKPSETALPRSGQFAFPVRPNAAAVMGVQGPLARSAEDLELGLSVAAGAEVGEDVAWRLEFPAPRADRLADLRVAIMPRIDWLPVSAEILEAMDAFVAGLARAGATVRAAQPELFGDMRDHHGLYLSMMTAVTSARLTPDQREHQVQLLLDGGAQGEWASTRMAGLRSTTGDWFKWHARREEYRAAYRAFFNEWDVLLAPITLRTAFPHIEMSWPPGDEDRTRTIDIDDETIPYGNQVVYPGVATLSGQPATALPIGLSRSGLPIGLQAIGPYLEDRTPIRFAALASRELGGFLRPPGFE